MATPASIKTMAWTKQNPDKAKAINKRMMQRVQDRLQKAKTKPCMDCKGNFPPICMDFDHRDPDMKTYPNTSMKAAFRRRPGKLQEELAKCDVVCANCHRIRTEQRRLVGQ